MKSNLIESTNLSTLVPDLNYIEIIFMWSTDKNCEIDLSVFLLDDKGTSKDDKNFLYYNNKVGANGAIKLLKNNIAGASVAISLDDLKKNLKSKRSLFYSLSMTLSLAIRLLAPLITSTFKSSTRLKIFFTDTN